MMEGMKNPGIDTRPVVNGHGSFSLGRTLFFLHYRTHVVFKRLRFSFHRQGENWFTRLGRDRFIHRLALQTPIIWLRSSHRFSWDSFIGVNPWPNLRVLLG